MAYRASPISKLRRPPKPPARPTFGMRAAARHRPLPRVPSPPPSVVAERATKQALGELLPLQRLRAVVSGLRSTKPVLKEHADALAFATQPSITFSTSRGKLETPDPLGTARHEVAHFALPGMKRGRYPSAVQTGRQHFSMRAAGARGEALFITHPSVLRRLPAVERMPSERRIGLAGKWMKARGG